jgi:hypothetical protein
MSLLTPRAIAILLVLKVIFICAILIYLNIIPNPLSLIVGNGTSHNLVGCTKEARVCPDGSYVGRVGPSCEFKTCAENMLEGTPEKPGEATSTNAVSSTTLNQPLNVACTMDAKQCPDGSYVGRTGPSCQFESCSAPISTSETVAVRGTVMVGPTCPVERTPPEDACAPKPFEGSILLTNTAHGKEYTVNTDALGAFSLTLERGVYSISRPENSSPFPSCTGKVEILSSGAPIPLFCDSGIR